MMKTYEAYKQREQRHKVIILLSRIILILVALALWETLTRLEILNPFIFSSPTRVCLACIELLKNGQLFYHVGITLFEMLLGFLIGTGSGIIIAIILWWFPLVAKTLDPYLVVLNALPKTALAPILIVWFGNNMTSIVIMSILISIVITVLNTLTGFNEVAKDKITLITSFGGNRFTALKKVLLPANIPTLMNVLRVNIGLCLVGVIIGEFLVAQSGLGYLIVYGSQIFKMDWVMLSILLLGFIAAILYQLIVLLEKFVNRRHM